ncbi:hypothetical protein FA10DRAFT_294745 [Acaromyces ingoldii]|uniref:Uncharacterized protein n=1 Tax=Acaromyces ingoldii TaxID=215250 RepID=A0A316YHH9_9BASI|nr:hypothetical protein FA10DRAFT_294745 [Acaromyces ingoldii]PWN88887.1 hypothetical protein FA10DRAFT_294745 [Acaromyces ingoldii]
MKAYFRFLLVLAILIAAFVAKSLSQPIPGGGKHPNGNDRLGGYTYLGDGSGRSDDSDEHVGRSWVGELKSAYNTVTERFRPGVSGGSSRPSDEYNSHTHRGKLDSQPIPGGGRRPTGNDGLGWYLYPGDDSGSSDDSDEDVGSSWVRELKSTHNTVPERFPPRVSSVTSHTSDEHVSHTHHGKLDSTQHFAAKHVRTHKRSGSRSNSGIGSSRSSISRSSSDSGISRNNSGISSSSSSGGGGGISHISNSEGEGTDYLSDLSGPVTASEPCVCSKKNEQQREKFNDAVLQIRAFYKSLYQSKDFSKVTKGIVDEYFYQWELLGESIRDASSELRKKMNRLARDEEEWEQWKSGEPFENEENEDRMFVTRVSRDIFEDIFDSHDRPPPPKISPRNYLESLWRRCADLIKTEIREEVKDVARKKGKEGCDF